MKTLKGYFFNSNTITFLFTNVFIICSSIYKNAYEVGIIFLIIINVAGYFLLSGNLNYFEYDEKLLLIKNQLNSMIDFCILIRDIEEVKLIEGKYGTNLSIRYKRRHKLFYISHLKMKEIHEMIDFINKHKKK